MQAVTPTFLPNTLCLPSPPHFLHTFIASAEHLKHQSIENKRTPHDPSCSHIEQHELCVAFIVRRHCGNLHHTVPHNELKVTCLAIYSNILFYKLDEAFSNAVSSEGGIVVKCLFLLLSAFCPGGNSQHPSTSIHMLASGNYTTFM